MNLPTPEQILAMSLVELAALPGTSLFEIKNNAAALLSSAKSLAEHIECALELKYAERAQAFRQAAGKDTGTTHFNDDCIRITADLPKRVEWDQSKLTALVKRIAEAGDDPSQYVEVNYRVSETKYNAWPQVLREQFSSARTLKFGKPSFRLARTDEVSA
jgi:hypothetical protein